MGDVLDPKPPQWQRKVALEDVPEDRVLLLAGKLKAQVDAYVAADVDSMLVQLVAIRLVLKAIVGNYRNIVGHEAARELMRQASEMCEQYQVNGIDDHPEQ